MDPGRFPIRPVLLFPDRGLRFQLIDGMATGGKRLVAMRAAHGYGHADVADTQMTQPVNQSDFADRPAAAHLRLDVGHLSLGHSLIRFIFQGQGPAAISYFPNRSHEKNDGPAVRALDIPMKLCDIDWSRCQFYHFQPPLTGGSTATSVSLEIAVSADASF